MDRPKAQHRSRKWYRVEGEKFLLSAEAAARFFGVSAQSLRDWVKHGCPRESRGWYDPAAVLRWRNGENRTTESSAGETLAARQMKAETLYRERKAERERIFLEAQMEMYLPRDAVETEWSSRIIELKTGLLGMGRKAAAALADPAQRRIVERVINDEVYDLLDQYARTGTYSPRARGKAKAKAGGEASEAGAGQGE